MSLNIPSHLKKYLVNTYFEGIYNEEELSGFLSYNFVKDPQYYRNELNAYMKEKELCPDVSESYTQEREYRIWFYGEMIKEAEKYY